MKSKVMTECAARKNKVTNTFRILFSRNGHFGEVGVDWRIILKLITLVGLVCRCATENAQSVFSTTAGKLRTLRPSGNNSVFGRSRLQFSAQKNCIMSSVIFLSP
jgi:hypothetical protein